MAPESHDALVRFIRHTLGCECPDELLRRIVCDREPAASEGEPGRTRIDAGGRLLVYVIRSGGDPAGLRSAVRAALEAGIEERDRRGFNRFRLVLATADVDAVDTGACQAFAGLHRPDDRIHLHVVPLAEVPEVARPEGP